MLEADGQTVIAIDRSGDTVRSATHLWAGGVRDAVVLSAITPGPTQQAAPLPEVDGRVTRAAAFDKASDTAATVVTSQGPLIGLALGALAASAIALAVILRRQRRQQANR